MGRIRRARHGHEWYIQNDIREFMESRGWHVERFVGNALQYGIPDLNAAHPKWGERWIEVKVASKYTFTDKQRKKFPLWSKSGRGIWVLTGATQTEYHKLFKAPNWEEFWKPSWGEIPDIDAMILELQKERALEE